MLVKNLVGVYAGRIEDQPRHAAEANIAGGMAVIPTEHEIAAYLKGEAMPTSTDEVADSSLPAYEVVKKGKAWFVVDSTGTPVHEGPLKKKAAEELLLKVSEVVLDPSADDVSGDQLESTVE